VLLDEGVVLALVPGVQPADRLCWGLSFGQPVLHFFLLIYHLWFFFSFSPCFYGWRAMSAAHATSGGASAGACDRVGNRAPPGSDDRRGVAIRRKGIYFALHHARLGADDVLLRHRRRSRNGEDGIQAVPRGTREALAICRPGPTCTSPRCW